MRIGGVCSLLWAECNFGTSLFLYVIALYRSEISSEPRVRECERSDRVAARHHAAASFAYAAAINPGFKKKRDVCFWRLRTPVLTHSRRSAADDTPRVGLNARDPLAL